MSVNPVHNSPSLSTPPINLEKSQANAIPIPLTQASAALNASSKVLTAEKIEIVDIDISSKELADLLTQEKELIDSTLARFEIKKEGLGTVENAVKLKKGIYGIADTASETVEEGIGFLEAILPEELLEEMGLQEHFTTISKKIELGQGFLKALDLGLNGLALIYKTKILNESVAFLEKIKEDYKSKKLPLPKQIKEWEININSYLEEMSNAYISYGLKSTKQLVSLSKLFFKLFPASATDSSKNLITKLGSAASVIGFILAAIDLKEAREDSKTYDEWISDFRNWEKANHAGGKITPANIKPGETLTPPVSISRSIQQRQHNVKEKDYTAILDGLIHSNASINKLQSYLTSFGFTLNPRIKTKKQVIRLWENSNIFRNELVDKLKNYHQIQSTLDDIIKDPKNLLEKREAIVHKKLIKLRPQFDQLKPKLMELKKEQLIFSLKQIVAEASQYPVNIQHIRNRLSEELNDFQLPASIQTSTEAINYLSMKGEDGVIEPSTAFEQWFDYQDFDKDSLLKTYIDHQETVEKTTKNALQQMVNKKHEVEGKFIKFKVAESWTNFSFVTVSLVASIVIGGLVLASIPFGGGAVLLAVLSIGATAAGFGLTGAGYYMMYQHRNSSWGIRFTLNKIALSFDKLMMSIRKYSYLSNQRSLIEKSKIVNDLKVNSDKNSEKYQKALQQWKETKKVLQENQKQIEYWSKKAKKIENHLTRQAWHDFSYDAQLKNPTASKTKDLDKADVYDALSWQEKVKLFDTLEALTTGLQSNDLTLLDEDTKLFFNKYLDMDLQQFQKSRDQIDKIPNAIRSFFSKDDSAFLLFINSQNKRFKSGLIGPIV